MFHIIVFQLGLRMQENEGPKTWSSQMDQISPVCTWKAEEYHIWNSSMLKNFKINTARKEKG